MRNLVMALVLLNLGFFAYAAWIDQPERTAADDAPALPKLLLASEFPQGIAAATAAGRAGAAQEDPPSAAIVSPGSGSAATTSTAPANAPATAANQTSAVGGATAAAATDSGSCVAVGPFNDAAGAAHATSVLKDRGFAPRERRAPGDVAEGFWVHVENIATAADQSRVMRTLQQAGLSDASPVQSADQIRHISVGIFTERVRAERRANAVKRLGIEAEVSPRMRPGTVYWLEMEPRGGQPSLPIEGVATSESTVLEVRACSAVPAGAPTARR